MASLLNPPRAPLAGWNEFICHTNFSFLVGASHPDELVKTAAAYGYKRLAITDYDGVYGLARAYRALQDLKKDGLDGGLELVYGAEFHLQDDLDEPTILQDTVVLLAQNAQGYHHLCQLASYSHLGGKLRPKLPLAHLLAAATSHLIVIVPMRGLVHSRPLAVVRERLGLLQAAFPGRTYLGVTRHLNPAEDQAIGPTLDLSRSLELPCLLTQDAFFHQPGQKDLSDLLHAIRLNQPVAKIGSHLFANASRCLHSQPVLTQLYRPLQVYSQALRAAEELGESCQFSLAELAYKYPQEMLPAGVRAQDFLEEQVWQQAKAHYGLIPDKARELLVHELALIRQLEFADYFLTVWEIVAWARGAGILCQGRGSAANSAVCFVLGITPLDPVHYDMLFERFISVERGDPPDIDVDFEHERREEVIQHIYERYGRDRAAMVANVITFRRKGALRASGKALGIPAEYLLQASQLMATKAFRKSGSQEALATVKDEAKTPDGVRWAQWGMLAERLRGFPRHLGIHSGGFMLADKTLDHLVAQEPATMPGRSVIQWCKDDIEALGFFKIDILALGMLTALRKCLHLVQTHYKRDLTLRNLPQGDQGTYDMICRAQTVGTFQIESRAQMGMLPRLKPRCLYDLVIEVAIIRPGPIQGKMVHPYLRRRSGMDQVTYPDERLRPILSRTLGIPIFQEQVMRIAMAVGGFSAGEADELRKNIGSFSLRGKVERWIGRLQEGMRANGLSEEFIETLTLQLHGFAHYGFPESHAASFAQLAYASSYLKCYYPAAFFAALLSSQPMGFYTPHTLLQTASRVPVKILKICCVKSQWESTLEAVPGDSKYALRLGLSLVRSLSKKAALDLVARRECQGGWRELLDVVRGGRLSRRDFSALAAADALHLFGVQRREAVWLADAAPFCLHLEDVHEAVGLRSESEQERVQADFRATGTTLGVHPTQLIRREGWAYPVAEASVLAAKDLAQVPAGKTVTVFGMAIIRQAPPSARGMVFITLEDHSGLMNIAVTPEVYQKDHRGLDGQVFLCLEGKLQKQGAAHSLLVKKVVQKVVRSGEILPFQIVDLEKVVEEDVGLWGAAPYPA